MWGFNPAVLAKVAAAGVLLPALVGRHGAVRATCRQVERNVATNDIRLAKEVMRSIAAQDRRHYERLVEELKRSLSDEELEQILA